jgi:hypothetical protein
MILEGITLNGTPLKVVPAFEVVVYYPSDFEEEVLATFSVEQEAELFLTAYCPPCCEDRQHFIRSVVGSVL